MAYINCEQYHIDNNTRHIFIKKKKKHAMKNTNISIKRNEKKKKNHKNKIKYLLAWMYPSMEEYFRNPRNFHFFEI